MDLCKGCDECITISGHPVICTGPCNGKFHFNCAGLTKTAARLVAESANLFFKCNECLTCSNEENLEENVSVSDAKMMGEAMKQLSSVAESITDIRNNVASQIDSALKNGMDAIMENVNGTLKERVDSFEKLITKKMESMTSSFFDNNCEKILAARNEKVNNEMRPVHSESVNNNGSNSNAQNKMNYASVLKTGKKNREARPVIVVKPKESNQSSEDTRNFVKSKLDPKTHKISNFRNGKDGSIIVECAMGENVTSVKNNIESNLGEKYCAVVPTPPVPRLKVLGVSEQLSSDEFIEFLKSQNEDIAIDDVKVVNIYENPRFVYNKYNFVIEVDKGTYNCLLQAKNVNVKWDWCPVVPAINVLRCFKCGEFGHKSVDCKNCDTCSRCSGQHKTSDCTSTVLKCVNCLKMKNERKLNLDVNHAAFSTECLVYQRLYEQKKSSMRFNK